MPYPATFEAPSRRVGWQQAQATIAAKAERAPEPPPYRAAPRWFYSSPFTYCARCGSMKNRNYGCLYCGK